MDDRTIADQVVGKAANTALLDLILPYMRTAAKDLGYALTVHGSLARDIDIVAIPWTEHPKSSQFLVDRLTAVISGITGRCNSRSGWTDKPQGRKAKLILVWVNQNTVDIDLSVIPFIPESKTSEQD